MPVDVTESIERGGNQQMLWTQAPLADRQCAPVERPRLPVFLLRRVDVSENNQRGGCFATLRPEVLLSNREDLLRGGFRLWISLLDTGYPRPVGQIMGWPLLRPQDPRFDRQRQGAERPGLGDFVLRIIGIRET